MNVQGFSWLVLWSRGVNHLVKQKLNTVVFKHDDSETMKRCGIVIFIIKSRTNSFFVVFDGLLKTIISIDNTAMANVNGLCTMT